MEEEKGERVNHSLPPPPPFYESGVRIKLCKDDIASLIEFLYDKRSLKTSFSYRDDVVMESCSNKDKAN